MQDFKQIIGNENIIGTYSMPTGRKSLPLLYYPWRRRYGKKLIASAFAKTLQCEEVNTILYHCKSCMQAETNNHRILSVTHEKKSIGVDDIRLQVNSDIFVKPYSSSYKIYIIDEAEKLTEQAQNALLKTIEEPPEYALFLLLVSNIATILPTILSRCIQLNLRPVGKEAIMEYLMTNHQIPDYLAEIAANFSGGNVGKALRYASSENFDL